MWNRKHNEIQKLNRQVQDYAHNLARAEADVAKASKWQERVALLYPLCEFAYSVSDAWGQSGKMYRAEVRNVTLDMNAGHCVYNTEKEAIKAAKKMIRRHKGEVASPEWTTYP